MRIFILAACCLMTICSHGQTVNEKITLQLIQPSQLKVNAGDDLNLSESGSAIIGESLLVSGGTPDFSHQWTDEENNLFLERTPEVFNPGRYFLTVTDQNHCSAIDSLSVYDYGTGISVQHAEMNVRVRPDPQNQLLFIEISQAGGDILIQLISMEGKVLYFFAQPAPDSPFSHTVGISTFKSGIYLIDVQYGQGHSIKKIVLP
ncbi:MAG: T9SS type A sorting domain-containing protein [Bacteroidales bacterium]